MSKYFHLHSFLKSAPNYLLREYFSRGGELTDIDWDNMGEYSIDPVFDALRAFEPERQDDIIQDFKALFELADGGFTKAIVAEAQYHGLDPDLSERFDQMKKHLERAFWTFLHRKEKYWEGALLKRQVDKIPETRWQKRGGLPKRPESVDEAVTDELRHSLIDYFRQHEARGRKCVVKAFRYGEKEIFHAYPQNFKDTVDEIDYNEDHLTPKTIQPVFEIIFIHNDSARTLDIYIEGDPTIVPKLQVAFAGSVLKTEIDEEYDENPPIYDLSKLLSSDFDFQFSNDLDINNVEIKAMRIRIEGEKWRRVTLEVGVNANQDEIYHFLAEISAGLPTRGSLYLEQVKLNYFRKGTARPAHTHTDGLYHYSPFL